MRLKKFVNKLLACYKYCSLPYEVSAAIRKGKVGIEGLVTSSALLSSSSLRPSMDSHHASNCFASNRFGSATGYTMLDTGYLSKSKVRYLCTHC